MNFNAGKTYIAAVVLLSGFAGTSQAAIVTSFDSAYTANGKWFINSADAGATATIVANAPPGGPLPTGAAKLTTDSTNPSKIEVSVADSYGTAGMMLPGINLQYSYFKQSSPGNNETAPSIKLTFSNPAYGTGGKDGYVTLIYEPYWNQPSAPGSSVVGPLNTWTDVAIDFTHGLFWNNGGFGQPNSAGGPPFNTLSNWLSLFDSTSGGAFSDAEMLALTVGIGSYTPDQIGYFDAVQLSNRTTGYSASYDFEAAAASVPEPGSLALVGVALLGLAYTRKKLAAY
jgi:PEP-CTERM motif-containing protein